MRQALRLSVRDLGYNWQASLCFVAALVGILAPLLIVFALKNGIVTTMLGQLVDDPSNRELIAIGARSHDAAFFERIGARPDVAFLTPATRSINAQANAVRHRAARRLELKVVLIPSAPGDPLSPAAEVAPGEVVLSKALAEALEAAPGDTVEMRIERRLGDRPETATRDLRVAGLVPETLYSRPAMFISLPDLMAVERFRDDRTISLEDWSAERPLPASYASFRLYARALGDVEGLEAALASEGVETRPRARNVALLLGFRRNVDLLFTAVALLALAGFWAAMAANLRGAVERQRRSLSLLRLLGLAEYGRRLIPAIQSVVLVLAGVGVSLVLVLPALVFVNRNFTPEGMDRIAWLGAGHVLGTVALGLVTAVTASLWAVHAVKEITSDEVLRSS